MNYEMAPHVLCGNLFEQKYYILVYEGCDATFWPNALRSGDNFKDHMMSVIFPYSKTNLQ